MGHKIAISGLAGLSALLAQVDVGMPALEKMSFAALTVALVYWITSRLSRQMDDQSAAIRQLAESIIRLTELTRTHVGQAKDQD